MALPVLDGNQSATTLSSVVTGGEHIVAHSVVCFGSTAIANITNAVSGSVASISNFPSTQTVAGTVTANLAGQNSSTFLPDIILTNGAGSIKASLTSDSITQICNDDGNAFNASNPLPISGTVTANLSNTVTATWSGAIGSSNAVPIV